MNPYLIIFALLSVIGSGWGGFQLGVDHNKASEIDKRAIVAEAVDAANSVSAEAIAKLIPKNTTIRQTLEKEIRENNIYHDCKSSDDSVRTFNSGIAGTKENPAGGLKLPRTNPPH